MLIVLALCGCVKFLRIAALVLTQCQPAMAELRITGGGYSTHLISDNVTNESHDHWAVQYRNVEIGKFNNSFDDEVWYVAYEWHRDWGDLQGFTKAGVMYGYRDLYSDTGDRGYLPMLAPGVRYTRWALQPEITLVGGALSLGLSAVF